jgi:AraC-like DNA-binding protein
MGIVEHDARGTSGVEVPERTSAGDGATREVSRTCLLDLSVGLVEDVRRDGVHRDMGPEGFCDDFQVCLPYRGLFVWHVGGDDVVGDPNQVLFVKARESYRMSGPNPEGYAELIVTPDLQVLSEVAHTKGRSLAEHPLFNRRTWPADRRLQAFRARFLHWAAKAPDRDPLEAEELVLALLRSALTERGFRARPNGARTARLIRRTKELLAERLWDRMQLADISRAVGASPAYLTDVFSRVEGTPLHQYLIQLRLARALVDLPHTNDLTALALDLGFSSHSHFSLVFRRAFGCTPSEFRTTTRRAARPSLFQIAESSSLRRIG